MLPRMSILESPPWGRFLVNLYLLLMICVSVNTSIHKFSGHNCSPLLNSSLQRSELAVRKTIHYIFSPSDITYHSFEHIVGLFFMRIITIFFHIMNGSVFGDQVNSYASLGFASILLWDKFGSGLEENTRLINRSPS